MQFQLIFFLIASSLMSDWVEANKSVSLIQEFLDA